MYISIHLAHGARGAVLGGGAGLVRLAAGVEVVGVSAVSGVADAVHVVVVGHAERVGAADHVGAGVAAELLVPVGDGLADLVVAAVGGVDAGGGGGATLDRVVGVVALESGLPDCKI